MAIVWPIELPIVSPIVLPIVLPIAFLTMMPVNNDAFAALLVVLFNDARIC